MHKDILLQNKIHYNENYYYAADYNLLVDISRIGCITNTAEYLFYYRNHSDQISFAKKNDQNLYKRQIQLSQLSYFRIRPSVDEIIIHQSLLNENLLSTQQLEAIEKWCNKLITKNHRLKLYNEEYLYNFLKKKIIKAILIHNSTFSDKY
jgi:hypothetical protein